MSSPKTAGEVLEDCYLEIRAQLIQIAASLDRIDRADSSGTIAGDPGIGQFREAFDILGSEASNRTERIQMIFSDEYEPAWKTQQP